MCIRDRPPTPRPRATVPLHPPDAAALANPECPALAEATFPQEVAVEACCLLYTSDAADDM
eukprot:8744573-Alexandrium_andersonii.AAC.1